MKASATADLQCVPKFLCTEIWQNFQIKILRAKSFDYVLIICTSKNYIVVYQGCRIF